MAETAQTVLARRGYVFEVPPGIGDISWCYEKLYPLVQRAEVGFLVCNDPPQRSLDFVDILPRVVNLGYHRPYHMMLKRLLPYPTNLERLPPGQYAISMNPHLEAGRHISKAFPQQGTKYHYPLNTSPEHVAAAQQLLEPLAGRRIVGVYCSFYKHRPAVSFWAPPDWLKFLKLVHALQDDIAFVMLGATFDDRTMDVFKLLQDAKLPVVSAVGTAHIGLTVELIRRLKYFFAFPSGLAIMADVVDTPCTMWYWSNVKGMEKFSGFPNSYADPKSVASNRHVNQPYLDPHKSFELFLAKGACWLA